MTPDKSSKTISIRRNDLASDEVREVAELAFRLWLAAEFRDRTPEEALFTAVRQMRSTTAGLFVVPKRNSKPCSPHLFSVVALN